MAVSVNRLWRTRRVVLDKTVRSTGWCYDDDYNVIFLEKDSKGTAYMYRLPDEEMEAIPIAALEKLVHLCATDAHQAILVLHGYSQGESHFSTHKNYF